MSKKLEANGLWESSRMILPQHKDLINQHRQEIHRIPRPILDDQELEFISSALMQSHIYQKNVKVTLYDEYQPHTITGIVTRSQRDSFRMDTVDPFDGAEDWEWISYHDVLKVELITEWTEEEMIDF